MGSNELELEKQLTQAKTDITELKAKFFDKQAALEDSNSEMSYTIEQLSSFIQAIADLSGVDDEGRRDLQSIYDAIVAKIGNPETEQPDVNVESA